MRFNLNTEGPQVATRKGVSYQGELQGILARANQEAVVSPAERIAEHTGHREYFQADELANYASDRLGLRFTSGERALLANLIRNLVN